MGPIKPSDAIEQKGKEIPEEVIEVFNKLIVRKLVGRTAKVDQDEAVTAITEAMNCSRQTAFENGWLDVESSFIAAGWEVYYYKPAYYEDRNAYFEFTAGKNAKV